MSARRGIFTITALTVGLMAGPGAFAQSHGDLHRAVDAAILSDVAADRQAEREAKRQPYASPGGYGSIATAGAARDACSEKALAQAGMGARILGTPSASTMSTGWEVEGMVGSTSDSVPFVCSVRNGSVTGILLRRGE
ncbi:hypothetical protein [Sphingobium cloacae]|uniref:Uncharacterized protein n=1 Tax=Sphingobium cloacae TaxID=120107 RepID=A0A1E1F6Z0_9SPHN|nr:hypothetical protein [Sphingobium cloacae]BAV66171.1 hypothetical protein SCLO_1031310 [Sphingobium cloacae]